MFISLLKTICSPGWCVVNSSGCKRNTNKSIRRSRIFAALTLNFGPRLRSALGGLKSLLLSRCAPTYISMLRIGSPSNESRTSVTRRDPRPRGASPPLPPSIHTPPTLQPPSSSSPLGWRRGGRGFAFGVFSDVSHVARQSIRKSVTRGQL